MHHIQSFVTKFVNLISKALSSELSSIMTDLVFKCSF